MKRIYLLTLIIAFSCADDDPIEQLPSATVISINPNEVLPGEDLTINGTNFGTDIVDVRLSIGAVSTLIKSIKNDELIVEVPQLEDGQYSLELEVRNENVPVSQELTVLANIQFETLLSPVETLPFGTVKFMGAGIPLNKNDNFSAMAGTTQLYIDKVESDGVTIFVPREIAVGEFPVTIEYNGQRFTPGAIDVIDWRSATPGGFSFINLEDGSPMILDSALNMIVPSLTGDGTLDYIGIQKADGSQTHIEVAEDGLPLFVYHEDLLIVFNGYDFGTGTVNLAIVENEDFDNAQFIYGIELNWEDLALISEGISYGGKVMGSYWQAVGASISVVGCALSVATTLTGAATPLGLIGMAATCTSATYDVAKFYNPEAENQLADIFQVQAGIKMDLVGCFGSLGSPAKTAIQLFSNINSCGSLVFTAADGLNSAFIEYRNRFENDIEVLQEILATGYGDIKITLTWDTTADIDLWVTDPSGARIWYQEPFNPTTNGELDRDDRDGYGPENVFWPVNQAPFGTYTVQVQYYGPLDGPVTTCQVIINNFGTSTTYTQALTPDGLATIAIFQAGSYEGGRVNTSSRNEVEFIDSSDLPQKQD